MIGATTLALLLTLARDPREDAGDYDRAMDAVARGRYVEALDEARSIEDPLLRAQAIVYACFRGRDYTAALRAAEAGLEAPERSGEDELDARVWLAERAAAAASYFQATAVLERALERLDGLVARLPAGESRAGWEAAAAAYEEVLDGWIAAEAERIRAVERARAVALTTAGLAALCGLFLLRRAGAQGTSVQSLP